MGVGNFPSLGHKHNSLEPLSVAPVLSPSLALSLHSPLPLLDLDLPHYERVDLILEALVTRPKYPPYCETSVAIPLSHCVSCGIADYRCYTPTSFLKNPLSQSKDRP